MTINPDNYKTPGQLISALLEQREWTKRVLAIVLGMDETLVSRIVADKRPVTVDLAILLEEVFGVRADAFLDLQRSFDLAKARLTTIPDPKRATRAHLFGGLPVSEMVKRGWLPGVEDVRDVPAVEAALTKFFQADSLQEIETLPHAAKRTAVSVEPTPAQLAWIYRVKRLASEMLVPRYTAEGLHYAIIRLRALMGAPEEARKVPRILAEAGVRFLIVEALPSTKIDGVCFWLDDNSPVVALTCRLDRVDNFWFVLRHELEHVLLRHGRDRMMLDADLQGQQATSGAVEHEESIANIAAAEFCVPAAKMESFIARKSPLFHERDILGFANTLGVHPGVVAGQLQHKTGRYDLFRNHLAKIRGYVRPSAIVDGWGDVAPVGFN